MSTIKNQESGINNRTFVSTYLSKKEAKLFEDLLGEAGCSRAALAKGLLVKALSLMKTPISSRQVLEVLKLSRR